MSGGGDTVTLDAGICVLREHNEKDRDALVRHANDADVARFLRDRFPHPYTAADADWWHSHLRGRRAAGEPVECLAVVVDGELCGGVSVERGSDIERHSAEIGYWLGRSVWGRKIATAAVRCARDWAFRSHGVERLHAEVMAGNAASVRVLEKAGFRHEGVARRAYFKNGQFHDAVVLAITRPDWDALQTE